MKPLMKKALVGLTTAAFMSVSSVAAVQTASADPNPYVHYVGGKKKWKKGYNKRYWRPYYGYRGYAPNYWVGPAIGFGTGLIVGSILVAPRYYGPAPRSASRDAACHRKYRSYNSRTGTYTGYDGKQHSCRLP